MGQADLDNQLKKTEVVVAADWRVGPDNHLAFHPATCSKKLLSDQGQRQPSLLVFANC